MFNWHHGSIILPDKSTAAMLIALIVICITVVMAVLVTRKDLCEVRIRTGQTEVAVFTAYESEE
ncbi:type I toxin-antitoxin system Hok family toxin [Salmonella enterica subsp. enterica serovar Lomalinda]|nr:type I toxin-antitoxin system Hok family toxin [Salmonella enterica subsp. enterica serovar Lomalinda]ECI5321624.1 type I toxin-antitoxin system hok family toxin [Salmonella enterica subsp. enterica serovar Lomalinda]